MPVYQYKCLDCQNVYDELWLSISEAEETEPKFLEEAKCPKCGSTKKQRLLSSPMISFKGEGWTSKVIGPEGSSGRRDTSGALKEHGEKIKDEVRNLTSKDLYGI